MADYKCTMRLTSHGVIVTKMAPMAKAAIWEVLSQNRSYKTEWNPRTKKATKVIDASYFFIPEDRSHLAFHRSQLPEILHALSLHNIDESRIETIYDDLYEGEDVVIEMVNGYKPRDYQVPIVQHVYDHSPIAVVPAQTGQGKGLISLFAAQKVGKRFGAMCASKYMVKWYKELEETVVGISPTTCITLSGTKEVLKAYNREKDFRSKGESTGVICYIFSLETLNSFIKRFIFKKEYVEGLDPFDLMQTLGIGYIIKDEVHELFHQLFKVEVYTHCKRVCALSATIEDRKDQFKEKMYHLTWPSKTRYTKLAKKRYTNVYSYTYSMPNISPTAYQRQGNYSHQKLEESLLQNDAAKEDYLQMIKHLVDEEFIAKRKTGERCLVYTFMNEMTESVSSYLSDAYPYLNVGEYIRQDPLSNILESDITVTSPIKAAAALDVPLLSSVVNMVNTGSQKRIVQTAGRLRELTDSETRYVYAYSPDIPKHTEYAQFANECLREVVSSFNEGKTKYHVNFVKNNKYAKRSKGKHERR